jgi:hypothetical protein
MECKVTSTSSGGAISDMEFELSGDVDNHVDVGIQLYLNMFGVDKGIWTLTA